jgi:CheY-like chemotaxis protein
MVMHSPGPSDRHILVVEDDLATREALAMFLAGQGYRVTTAEHGRAALQLLRDDLHPDLILLDLMMPIMDGWEFRSEQLADPQLSDIPVIICSATGRLDEHADSLRACAYLDKPINPAELVALVQRSFSVTGR